MSAKRSSFGERYRKHRQEVGFAVFLIAVMILGLFFVGLIKDDLGLDEQDVLFGATFSKPYAESLGLDWREAYLASLDELGVRRYRIPVYWTDLERVRNKFDYSVIDWQVQEAAKRGADVVLAIGRKVPRWPECHVPEWAKRLTEDEVRAEIIEMLRAVVTHFKDDPTVIVWQVENEPMFKFGECPEPDRKFLQREIAVVRSLDDRPIMLTESGELSTWLRVAGLADILGISTYREVWTKYIGYFYWPISPKYYTQRARAILPLVDRIIVSELQVEPWSPDGIDKLSIEQQRQLMNPEKLADNVSFVRRIGFSEAYLWGIEWWYWMKQHDAPELWEAGIRLYGGPTAERPR
jgi:hypothetical protein